MINLEHTPMYEPRRAGLVIATVITLAAMAGAVLIVATICWLGSI